MEPNFVYNAVVVSVYDADTIRMDIDLGMNTWIKNEPIRLYGIDAPEVRGEEREEGLISRDYVRELLPAGAEVVIATRKDKKGKYGRYVADVYYSQDGKQVSLNEDLVDKGLAEWVSY